DTPMTCPLLDGSTTTMGAADCRHELLRAAIADQGAASRSANLAVCVTPAGGPACSVHVVTTRKNGVNTDPASPADYQSPLPPRGAREARRLRDRVPPSARGLRDLPMTAEADGFTNRCRSRSRSGGSRACSGRAG